MSNLDQTVDKCLFLVIMELRTQINGFLNNLKGVVSKRKSSSSKSIDRNLDSDVRCELCGVINGSVLCSSCFSQTFIPVGSYRKTNITLVRESEIFGLFREGSEEAAGREIESQVEADERREQDWTCLKYRQVRVLSDFFEKEGPKDSLDGPESVEKSETSEIVAVQSEQSTVLKRTQSQDTIVSLKPTKDLEAVLNETASTLNQLLVFLKTLVDELRAPRLVDLSFKHEGVQRKTELEELLEIDPAADTTAPLISFDEPLRSSKSESCQTDFTQGEVANGPIRALKKCKTVGDCPTLNRSTSQEIQLNSKTLLYGKCLSTSVLSQCDLNGNWPQYANCLDDSTRPVDTQPFHATLTSIKEMSAQLSACVAVLSSEMSNREEGQGTLESLDSRISENKIESWVYTNGLCIKI